MARHFCGCVHEFQDKKYGKGMRVTTPVNKSNSGEVRCTACGNSLFPGGGASKKTTSTGKSVKKK